MVSIYTVFTAAVVGVAAIADAASIGPYYRPPAVFTSGVPGNTKAIFSRSPCPAINTLANHGVLPRDGKNISNVQLRDAVMNSYNLELALADRLVSVLPASFDLSFLGTHGIVEHDASLVHADSVSGADPSAIDPALLKDTLSRATKTSPFTVATMGALRKARLAATVANTKDYVFGAQQVTLAFGEAALILTRFGNLATETASLSRVQSFLQYEQFPSDWKTPADVLTTAQLTTTSVKIIGASQ